MRLGFLFPPCGGEDELYVHGEALGDDLRILLMGTRIFGDDEEHAPHHLRRTGAIDHLVMHAEVMARMKPDAVIWACTSGSFIDGLSHAERQVEAIAEITACPVSSRSRTVSRTSLSVSSSPMSRPLSKGVCQSLRA